MGKNGTLEKYAVQRRLELTIDVSRRESEEREWAKKDELQAKKQLEESIDTLKAKLKANMVAMLKTKLNDKITTEKRAKVNATLKKTEIKLKAKLKRMNEELKNGKK